MQQSLSPQQRWPRWLLFAIPLLLVILGLAIGVILGLLSSSSKGAASTAEQENVVEEPASKFFRIDPYWNNAQYVVRFDNTDFVCVFHPEPKAADGNELAAQGTPIITQTDCGYVSPSGEITKNFGIEKDFIVLSHDRGVVFDRIKTSDGDYAEYGGYDDIASLNKGQQVVIGDVTCTALGGEGATCSLGDKSFTLQNGNVTFN